MYYIAMVYARFCSLAFGTVNLVNAVNPEIYTFLILGKMFEPLRCGSFFRLIGSQYPNKSLIILCLRIV